MTRSDVLEAYRFFRGRTGLVGHDAECALALARAEAAAEERGWRFEWTWCEDEWYGDCPAPKELLDCIAYDEHGRVVASLGSIGDPDRAYVRQIEAELALEASAHISEPCSGVVEVCR